MRAATQPTPAELEILDVLWERKRATVREVFEDLSERRSTQYTTVLKLMQIMQEKGIVTRDETEKAHIYRPKLSQRRTRRQLVSNLVEKAFRGSALSLVQHVLEAKPASREELNAIREMIDKAEKEAKK